MDRDDSTWLTEWKLDRKSSEYQEVVAEIRAECEKYSALAAERQRHSEHLSYLMDITE